MGLVALTTAAYAFLVGPLLAFLVTGDYANALPPRLVAMLPVLDLSSFTRDSMLVALPVMLVVVSAIKGAAHAGQFYLMGTIGQFVVADLRRALFGKLVSMPPSFYAHRHTGDLYSRLSVDVVYIEQAIVWALSSYIRDTLLIVVLLTQCFVLDWRLSLIAFGAVPVIVYPVVRFAKWLKRVTKQSHEAMSRVSQTTHEALGAVRVVQAFGAEARERARYHAATEDYLAVMRRSLLVRATSTPTMELIAVVGVASAIAFAGKAVAAGEIDGSVFLSFMATVLLLYQPAKSLGRVGNFMMQGLAGAERVFELMDTPNEIVDRPGARELPPIRESIRFERVGFRYQPRAEGGQDTAVVLNGVDLKVRRGEIVAIVGPSGSGKSTLLNLVPRFYDPSEGRVTLDGVDLREATLASLRAQIAVVTQETLLFNESVAANVAYGRPGATRPEIEAAARAADAHEFISSLPDGYDTVIGEKGVTLSGGQRQRLAIARALLKDAPILVLDEATSALDAESEAEVQRALDRLMKDRTVLVVAHRLSTIRNANRIVVLVNGRIVEVGTHDELVGRGGEYARMCDLQFGDRRVQGVA